MARQIKVTPYKQALFNKSAEKDVPLLPTVKLLNCKPILPTLYLHCNVPDERFEEVPAEIKAEGGASNG